MIDWEADVYAERIRVEFDSVGGNELIQGLQALPNTDRDYSAAQDLIRDIRAAMPSQADATAVIRIADGDWDAVEGALNKFESNIELEHFLSVRAEMENEEDEDDFDEDDE